MVLMYDDIYSGSSAPSSSHPCHISSQATADYSLRPQPHQPFYFRIMDQSEAATSLSPLALAREDAIANASPTSRLPIASLSPGARSSAGESGAISLALAGRWQQRPPGRSRPPPAPLSPPAGRYRLTIGCIGTSLIASMTYYLRAIGHITFSIYTYGQ
jgi:hypothetical protein